MEEVRRAMREVRTGGGGHEGGMERAMREVRRATREVWRR